MLHGNCLTFFKTKKMPTTATIMTWLEGVTDPEIPVLSILDLGIVRGVTVVDEKNVEVVITPTYTGCPAMNMIALNIRLELLAHGIEQVIVTETLTPAWTTDWMSENGREKLKAYGIAPPQTQQRKKRLLFEETEVACPQCNSEKTEQIAEFGSTTCKALYRCLDCREPFDYFKCH
jgi:ring-1,2-phenylacetyl-CoA epoxidase subunit PaaD